MVNPRAFRWQTIADIWACTMPDLEIDWVGGWEPGLATQTNTAQLHIQRNTFGLLRRVLERNRNTPLPINTQTKTAQPSTPNPLLRWVKWLYAQTYWPDAVFFWQHSATQAAKQLLDNQPYHALFSIAPFFSAHWLALHLARPRPELFWVADYGDPFSPQTIQAHNNRRLYAGLNRWAEGQVLARANAITLTTPAQQQLYATAFPSITSKIHVIPPVLPKPAAVTTPAAPPFDPFAAKIRWLCVGKLYAAVRRPTFLLRLFAAVRQQLPQLSLELHFIGDSSAVQSDFAPYQSLLGQVIFQHGTVTQAVAQAAQQAAQVLVNIGNLTTHQLPSKVVEYANTGLPVLNLAQVPDDSSAIFFKNYAAARTVWDLPDIDFDTQVQAICAWLQPLPQRLSGEQLSQFLQPYQASTVTQHYWELLPNL